MTILMKCAVNLRSIGRSQEPEVVDAGINMGNTCKENKL